MPPCFRPARLTGALLALLASLAPPAWAEPLSATAKIVGGDVGTARSEAVREILWEAGMRGGAVVRSQSALIGGSLHETTLVRSAFRIKRFQVIHEEIADDRLRLTAVDADGNVLAEYTLGAYQKLTVVAKVEGQVHYRDYNLAASGTKKDLPVALVSMYTRPTRYWQTDGAVAEAAKAVVKPNAKVVDNVHAVYTYVINRLTYNNDKLTFNVRQGAAKAFANPNNAVCLEYADLMIAMLRSQGIPARMVVGYAYAGSIKASPAVDDSLHSWVEAYVPGIGWMTVDPTWGEKFDDFGRSDLDHYAFATWGKNDSTPGAVMLGGSDTGYQYEDTQLSFSSVASSVPTSGSLAVERYTIAPFIALDRIHITAQSQIVSTGNRLLIGGRTVEIGSLAPSQDFTFTTFTLGSSWNKASEVILQRHIGGKDTTVAKSAAIVSYGPMLVLLLVIGGVYLLNMLRLRSKRRASRVKKIYTDNNRKRDILDE